VRAAGVINTNATGYSNAEHGNWLTQDELMRTQKKCIKNAVARIWPGLFFYLQSKLIWLRQSKLKRRVLASKKERKDLGFIYNDAPRLAFILLSFNHCQNIIPIISNLRKTIAEELIICDDGSIDGSEKEWLRHLTRPNDFLIRSNDIHEIRSYNRAIDFSRGDIVCVLQDDDIPPPDGKWVTDALALFERHPKLAILGCWLGLMWKFRTAQETHTTTKVYGHQAEPLASDWKIDSIPFSDPVLKMPFMFIQTVGIGPIFFRKDIFQDLGGFDLNFSKPGEPGIHLDHDICFKAWLNGYQVGLFEAATFRIGVGGQGTILFGEEIRNKNNILNSNSLENRYSKQIGIIDRKLIDANRQLNFRIPANSN
jgi:glycosyltransferase involved in cell wall biosynthesis